MWEDTPAEAKAFEIIEKLKWDGKATTADLRFLRNELQNPSSVRALYLAIRSIGRGAAATPENVRLVEVHLHGSKNDEVVAPAIETLCYRWDLAKDYLGVLFHYMELGSWSEFSDSGSRAFFCLGQHLHKTQEAGLFARLLQHVSADLALLSEDRPYLLGHLMAAYEAIRIGIDGPRAIVDSLGIVAVSDLNEEVLAEARRRAGIQQR